MDESIAYGNEGETGTHPRSPRRCAEDEGEEKSDKDEWKGLYSGHDLLHGNAFGAIAAGKWNAT
jgi:hypothetical protein